MQYIIIFMKLSLCHFLTQLSDVMCSRVVFSFFFHLVVRSIHVCLVSYILWYDHLWLISTFTVIDDWFGIDKHLYSSCNVYIADKLGRLMLPHIELSVEAAYFVFSTLFLLKFQSSIVLKTCHIIVLVSNTDWLTHSLTHSLTPYSRVHEKPIVTYLIKKFSTFYGTQWFITMCTRACHWSLSWARYIQFTLSHPVSLRSF
jgi:hypothetical protein